MSTNDKDVSLSTVDYLILGLVSWFEPCTSYDLKREVQRTISHFWAFSHSTLYQAPPQLAAAGLLTEQQEQTGRRRRLFRITDAGRKKLDEWLGETSAHPIELRDLSLLKLFLLGEDTHPDRALAIATAQVDYHAFRVEEYKELMDRYQPEPSYPTRAAALRFGLAWEQAALAFWTELAQEESANLEAGRSSMPSRDLG